MNDLWTGLIYPLIKLLLGLSLGQLLASAIETLKWTDVLAKLMRPLSKLAHLDSVACSAFSLSFASPAAANAMLAESYDNGKIEAKEIIIANLFNSIPSWFVHIPTIFFLTWPVLGHYALIYCGLTLLAAVIKTFGGMVSGRLVLTPPRFYELQKTVLRSKPGLKTVLLKTWQKASRRLPRLMGFTIPFYIIIFLSQKYGFFQFCQNWLVAHLDWIPFLNPQAMSIVVLQIMAEMGAALGAAAALLTTSALSGQEIVLAMLIGNILAIPARVIRHQFPVYVGFYKPRMALVLILTNQGMRAISLLMVIFIYLRIR